MLGLCPDQRAGLGWTATHSASLSVSYRYELRRSDEIVATGHLTREHPFEVGDRILIGSKHGVVRTIEPLLGEDDLRLVIQLARTGPS
jgi:hypothetical protein